MRLVQGILNKISWTTRIYICMTMADLKKGGDFNEITQMVIGSLGCYTGTTGLDSVKEVTCDLSYGSITANATSNNKRHYLYG